MKVKKIIAYGLCVSLMAVSFFGCGEQEKTKEKITLNIKLPPLTVQNHETNITDAYAMLQDVADKFIQQYEDADVSANIVKFEYMDEDEFITGAFDTSDAVDVLFEGYFNMSGYIYTGKVAPLDDIISDDLRSDVNDVYWDMSSVNGKTYMLPLYSLQNILGFNKELFRNCGLDEYIGEPDVIQSWTWDEWDNILSALSENLPDMSFPMMMYGKNNQGDTHIMTLLRSKGCRLFDDDGHFCVNTPEGIAALQWISDGCKNGYFPDGCANMELIDCNDLFINGQLAIYMINNGNIYSEPKEIGYVNFPSIDGKGINTSFLTGFMVFDNGDPEKLKASKEFLKFFYSQAEFRNYAEAAIPALNSVLENNAEYLKMSKEYSKNSQYTVEVTHNNPNWRGVRNTFYTHIYDLISGDKTPEVVARELDETCNAAIDQGWAESKLQDKPLSVN